MLVDSYQQQDPKGDPQSKGQGLDRQEQCDKRRRKTWWVRKDEGNKSELVGGLYTPLKSCNSSKSIPNISGNSIGTRQWYLLHTLPQNTSQLSGSWNQLNSHQSRKIMAVLASPQLILLKQGEIPKDLGEIPTNHSLQTCPRFDAIDLYETRRNPQWSEEIPSDHSLQTPPKFVSIRSCETGEIPTDFREIPKLKSFLNDPRRLWGVRQVSEGKGGEENIALRTDKLVEILVKVLLSL